MNVQFLAALLGAAALVGAWLLSSPITAFSTFFVLAVVAWFVARPTLFLAFTVSFALIAAAKLVTRWRTGGSDVARWGPANFLYSAGPPVLAVVVARFVPDPGAWELAALAGLAVVVSDTASAEVGASSRARAFLVTTFEAVPPGTDGGVSVAGSLAGLIGSVIFAILVATLVSGLTASSALVVSVLGAAGNALDSLLGATLQRSGRLTNEQVNGASVVITIVAALALVG